MIAQDGTAGKAGTVARAFQGGGKTDWFLPSLDELNALCKWAFSDTVNAVCNKSGSGTLRPTKGDFGLSGDVDINSYWSSSENYVSGATYARYQFFFTGNQNYVATKWTAVYVRPMRAF
jgi:hypothetical protein